MGAHGKRGSVVLALCVFAALLGTAGAGAAPPGRSRADEVSAHWTAERIEAAVPRDLVIDPEITAVPLRSTAPRARPSGGGSDTTGPDIEMLDPGPGVTISAPHDFEARVTDPSGVRSVTFDFYAGTGLVESFQAARAGDIWTVRIATITAGHWTWQVRATDGAKRGGNSETSDPSAFSVDESEDTSEPPPPPPTADVVTNAEYAGGGTIQTAAGRIYFEMRAAGRGKTRFVGYVCSGTVAEDGVTGRSVIITASHCVYDDVAKEFARNVLFIPNQAGTSGSATDGNCDNDPLGCWAPAFGVVDTDWADRQWPANIPWDHAFYVATDDSHTGPGSVTLDVAAGALPVQFTPTATTGSSTTALGYSYSEDPKFMYCREPLAEEGGNLWLPSCGLSGGASGGPWVQPLVNGSGPIVSVNSYGYSDRPGMGGPHLGADASCLFDQAKVIGTDTVHDC